MSKPKPKQKVWILRGLPASGKSTWAREFIAANAGKRSIKRINKDLLREMLDYSRWSKERERFIVSSRDTLIALALASGFDVISDDTNFHQPHIERIESLAQSNGAEVEIKDFDTPLEECLRRDRDRVNSVGREVIMRMYNQYVRPKIEGSGAAGMRNAERPARRAGFPECVIVDIDGTVALRSARGPFDWSRVGEDEPNGPVIELVRQLWNRYAIVFVSGRDDVCREATINWISEHVLPPGTSYTYSLFMRKTDDRRKDVLVKQEIYENEIQPHFDVAFVLDDRDQTVRGWRDLGLPTFQVAEGDF